jgi:hypothetical protein
MSALRAERAGAARQFFRQIAVDLESVASAMAMSGQCHYLVLVSAKILAYDEVVSCGTSGSYRNCQKKARILLASNSGSSSTAK